MDVGVNGELDRRAFLAVGASTVLLGPAVARRTRAPGPPVARQLHEAIRGPVIYPGNPGFAAAAHVYNERFDNVLPRAVARPNNVGDVQSAVKWAVANGVLIRARSGGHSYAGYSVVSKGLVVDLRNINGISVNRRAGTVTIGAGAQLIDVYAALGAEGATIPAGSCPSVAVAGHALGGGMGLAGRNFGLLSDNIVAAEIVTADGKVHQVNQRTNPDLLWGLRGGGGGNFGIVTHLTFKLHRIPATAAYFFVNFPWSQASNAIAAWLSWAPYARDQLTSILHLNAAGGRNSVNVTGQYFGPASDLGRLLAPLRRVPGASVFSGNQAYVPLQLRWAGCLTIGLTACHTAGTRNGGTLPREYFDAGSDYVTKQFSSAARQTLIRLIQQRARQPGSGAILFDSYGGAINRVSPSATAFVHRNTLACIQYLTYNGGSGWLNSARGAMRPYVSGQCYQNYIQYGLAKWQNACYGANYKRLLALRRSVDPKHVFTFPQAIGR
ncbi:MAG: FAD-binding oxidoreductase [Solirubrobacterales bacterium]|nr:FAD-binding oxidoreductase [Solirubrobacterales bacterium]